MSSNSNDELRVILRRLAELNSEKNTLEIEAEALWGAFFQIADQRVGEKKPFRFLDPESLMILARIIAVSENINTEKLEGLLTPEQWETVTEVTEPQRYLEPVLLEAAMKTGQVPTAVVEECLEKKITVRRWGPRPATKEELAELEAGEAQ